MIKLFLKPLCKAAAFTMLTMTLLLGSAMEVYADNNRTTWKKISGKASSLAVGVNGDIAAIGLDSRVYTYDIPQNSWSPIGNSFSKLAISQNGQIWGVDTNGTLRKYTGTQWEAIAGGAIDLAIGQGNAIYVVTNLNAIARYDGDKKKWTTIAGKAKALAIDQSGILWRLAVDGRIARKLDDAWIGVAGTAKDITTNNGQVLIIGTDDAIYEWNEVSAQWQRVFSDVVASDIASGNGQVVYANASGEIFASGLDNDKKPEIVDGGKGDGARRDSDIASNEPIIFTKITDNTKLSDLAIGSEGSVFGLTSTGEIRRWSNREKRFNEFPGQVDRLVVKSNGLPLAIGTKGNLVEHDGEAWRLVTLNLGLIDLSVFGNDNRVLVLSDREQVAKLTKELVSYTLLSKKGQQIATQKNGAFWVIDSANRLFKCDAQAQCAPQSIKASDIAIGPAGGVFVVDTNASLRRYDEETEGFDIIRQGNTSRVAVGPKDRPWILDNLGGVFYANLFERDESNDRKLALKTEATEEVTQTNLNGSNNSGIQIVQSISFNQVTIPTRVGNIDLGKGMNDITSGTDDIVIATGFADPCIDGTGRNWLYNALTKSFNHLGYLQRINLFSAVAAQDLAVGPFVNGNRPPSSPTPAIPSFFGKWNKSCTTPELVTYVSNVFNNPSVQASQNFNSTILNTPRGPGEMIDIDIAADGAVGNINQLGELEVFSPETVDEVRVFDRITFNRVGLGRNEEDMWAVSDVNNVYQFNSQTKSLTLRSFSADDKAIDVGVGFDGTVFIVNTSGILKKWDPASQRFIKTNKSNVTRVAVDSRGNPIVANFPSSQTVYFGR